MTWSDAPVFSARLPITSLAVESRDTTALTSFRGIKLDSKEKIVATYLVPLL